MEQQRGARTLLTAGNGWLLAALVLFALYLRKLLGFFPNALGLMGIDWQYYFPSFLNGYYAVQGEGWFSLHWFTPALCGGVPKFANPVDSFFSLPQVLFIAVGPVAGLHLGLILFAALGFGGMWLLLRNAFACGRPAALAGAAIFLFNGFYAGGMIVGHLTKHPFMLVPLIAWLLARGAAAEGGRFSAGRVLPLAGASFALAYTVWAGGFIVFPQMVLALCGIGFLAGLRTASFPAGRYFLAGLLALAGALALAAPKIAAVSALLGQFPRDIYSLPLVEGAGNLLRLFYLSLFGDAAALESNGLFHSFTWEYTLEEFDFGITWAPLALMAMGIAAWLARRPRLAPPDGRRAAAAAGLLLVMAVPLALNYYSPGWAALMKMLPLIKHASSNLRWLSVYIPLFAAGAAIGLEYALGNGRAGAVAGLAGAFLVAATALFPGRAIYQNQHYDPRSVIAAYETAAAEGAPPPVRSVDAYQFEGKLVMMLGANDLLAQGRSSFLCYEPVFGYRLEVFPWKGLRLGPVTDEHDGYLNLKNPACMVFPAENGCAPGDQFRPSEKAQAERFASYKGFDFAVSNTQRAANLVGLAAWLGLIALPLFCWFRRAPKA